jgi:hypothetical protein
MQDVTDVQFMKEIACGGNRDYFFTKELLHKYFLV